MSDQERDVRAPVSRDGGGARLLMHVRLNRRDIPDAELLEDLRAVAGRLKIARLSVSIYQEHGKFCGDTFKNRFGSWTRAVTLAGLRSGHSLGVGRDEILGDIAEVARQLGQTKLGAREYIKLGRFSVRMVRHRFGSWQEATAAAGISAGKFIPANKQVLLENLRDLWLTLGRQPKLEDLELPLSRCSRQPYNTHFGTFNKAMIALDRMLHPGKTIVEGQRKPGKGFGRRTSRQIGERLRYQILRRDNFRCCACGRSPATHTGVALQVDHKIAWRNGGETVPENLQTLCEQCNGGKSDLV